MKEGLGAGWGGGAPAGGERVSEVRPAAPPPTDAERRGRSERQTAPATSVRVTVGRLAGHPPLQATDTSAQDHTKDLTRPGLTWGCGPSRDCSVAWMHRYADLWEKPSGSSRSREKDRDTPTRSGL